jgi:ATP-dependent RNA helicase RhlE
MSHTQTQAAEPASSVITTFHELNLSPALKRQLDNLGFVTPTPVQAAAVPEGLLGKDVLATAQTGTGKTLAFLLPIIQRLMNQARPTATPAAPVAAPAEGHLKQTPGHAASQRVSGRPTTNGPTHPAVLILVPTRELALQVEKVYADVSSRFLPRAAVIIGGANENPQIQALKNGARVIVATPGRLEDLLDRRLVKLDRIEVLVLDEADRMLDMGFIPAIRRIVKKLPRERQSMCFSATIEPSVAHLLDEVLKNPVKMAFGSTTRSADSVKLLAYEAAQTQKADLLLRLVKANTGPALVFVGTKRKTEAVAKKLDKAGIIVAVLHGDRSQSQRVRALEQFQKGKAQVLVATDVASRGIHVDGIAQVINYDLPKIAEDFIHRAGRTGRAGETGIAVTFYTALERRDIAQLERKIGRKLERVVVEGQALEHEERVGPIDTSKIRLVTLPQRGGARPASNGRSPYSQNAGRGQSNGSGNGSADGKSRRRRFGKHLTQGNDARGNSANSPRVMLEGESLQNFE